MSTMKALVSVSPKTAQVKLIEIPRPREGEILVKVDHVAQNPTDWKAMRAVPEGRIIGCDFAGEIVDANGSGWQVGDRVAGFVHGTWGDPVRGSFAEYLVTEQDVVFKVPQGLKMEEAASLPLAFATAVQALFQRLGLPEPRLVNNSSRSSPSSLSLLINGGTSSVGKYAIQLAKAAGLVVFATGSSRNHPLLKDLGADHCIDYSDDDWPAQVRTLSRDSVEHAFDCISEKKTTGKISGALSSSKGGHIVTLLPTKDDLENPSKVKVESTIVYSVFGRELHYGAFDNCGAPRPEDKAFWVKYLAALPDLLTSGTIKPNRIRQLEGGLEGIMHGFELQSAGKVSAEKLVYRVS